jgi:2-oxo-3-hexenedioate decarboxylase
VGAIAAIVVALAKAQREHRLIDRPITRADATLADGYAVQRALLAEVAAYGAVLCGYKVGTTSAAAMARVGIDEPLYGFLIADGRIPDGGIVDMHGLTAPRIEMELAFITKADLAGATCTPDEVIAATDYVVPAFEIIDTRYTAGPFDVVAAVADNMSTARHVLGTQHLDPRTIDLAAISATLQKNGTMIAEGSGANVLDHPANAVAWLVRALAQIGQSVPAGSVVLSGGFADALPAADGDTFVGRYSAGGTISCTFRRSSSEGPS